MVYNNEGDEKSNGQHKRNTSSMKRSKSVTTIKQLKNKE